MYTDERLCTGLQATPARRTIDRMPIPAYIEARIRRAPPPECCVIARSTPVVSFGDSQTATVATLGLNPSRKEFLDSGGQELSGNARRLATYSSLGIDDLTHAPQDAVAQVLADCNGYFQRNPYRPWFDYFTPILDAAGASYYDGSACHLDLVQWATDPTWGRLQPAEMRKQLLAEDAAFLAGQLRHEHLRLLLVNGRGVIRQLRRTSLVGELRPAEPIIGFAPGDTKTFVGNVGRVRVFGWSTNLQSSRGVRRELRVALAERVATFIAGDASTAT